MTGQSPIFVTPAWHRLLLAALSAVLPVTGAIAAPPAPVSAPNAVPAPPAVPPSSYADVARFAADSSVIVDARIRRATALPDGSVAGLPPHLVRMAVEAQVNLVIYGSTPLARRIAWLVDMPRDSAGRAPRLRGRVLVFAAAAPAADRLQLVAPDAQLAWDAGRDATTRAIAAELAATPPGTAPPAITGIAQAFHVVGTIAGESETQIFLATRRGDPVSLTILRRPEQAPRWAVAFGEIVDESAQTPRPRSIGWFRLACSLPPRLPGAAIRDLSADDQRSAAADYAFVLRELGRCDATPVVITPAPLPPPPR